MALQPFKNFRLSNLSDNVSPSFFFLIEIIARFFIYGLVSGGVTNGETSQLWLTNYRFIIFLDYLIV